MSRYLSVFALAVRGSFYKVLWILAAAAALETGLFLVSLRRGADSLEQAVEQSGAAYGMALAFLAVTVFLLILLLQRAWGRAEGGMEG